MAAPAMRLADRLAEPVHEQRPVRQVGEAVVVELVRELLLDVLAVGDVAHHAGHAHRAAVGAVLRLAESLYPAHGAVAPNEPLLRPVVRTQALQAVDEDLPRLRRVVRMNAGQVVAEAAAERARIEVEQRLRLAEPVHRVAFDVPHPAG